MWAIEVNELTLSYQNRKVLDGLSLKVRQGEVFGFLGPNGAGKTSLIKTLLGHVFAQSGSVKLNGLSPADTASRRRIGYLPEETNYYRFLTPEEILSFYAGIFGMKSSAAKERISFLLKLVGLEAHKKRMISTFSKGMTQKVGLAQALINDPDTLILDEPTSGLDPLARMELRALLEDLRRKGKTVFFSSHELSEVELVCDTMAIIKNGRIVREGSLRQILSESREDNLEKFFLAAIGGATHERA